jgi:beta-phosphoglucomutase-like phosphatase (HAD superfamily)
MMHPRHERLLDYAAQRAKVRPDYLGWVLARYIERERISEAELATRLGSTPQDLPRLALCLRPRAEQFADDIRQISAKFHTDATALAGVVRLVESLETLAATNPTKLSAEAGLLMAARARKQPRQIDDDESQDHDPPRP